MMEQAPLAYFVTHPIQYQAPLLRYLSANGIALRVLYGCDPQAENQKDPLFEREIHWDVPLLEGYPSEILADTRTLPNSPLGGFKTYTKLAEKTLRSHGCRAVWIHGWGNTYSRTPFYSLAALRAARKLKLPVLLRGDSQLLGARGRGMRRLVHRWALSFLFRQAAGFLAVGVANADYYRAFGVPEEKITLMPYAVDNAFFQERCLEASAQREKLRLSLGLQEGSPVVLFCGRLAPEKDPALLLEAMVMLQNRDRKTGIAPPSLVIVGDGPLRSQIETLAERCLPGTVKLTGFRNQTELPAFYELCDVFVLPSSFEPWGLVVNEVMNAGKAIIVSDRVGAGPDLVADGINGATFPSGNAASLAEVMATYVDNPTLALAAGKASLERIQKWGFREDLMGLKTALGQIASLS